MCVLFLGNRQFATAKRPTWGQQRQCRPVTSLIVRSVETRDQFTNPKALPCVHAFCLKCLQRVFRDKSPKDKASCPTCRKEFQIPRGGVGALQHHFYIQQVLDLNNLRERPCDQHSDDDVMLYCHDCNENICLKCLCDSHKNHNTVQLREAADDCKLRIDGDDKQIVFGISSVREQSEDTKRATTEFRKTVKDVKKRVLATGDLVKRSVDDQINDVLMKLESVTSENDKQAETVQETYKQAVESMENFHTRSRALLDKGRPSDITREADELHDRATELLSKSNDITAVKYCPPHVTFTPADVTRGETPQCDWRTYNRRSSR